MNPSHVIFLISAIGICCSKTWHTNSKSKMSKQGLLLMWLTVWSFCGKSTAQVRYRCMLKDFIRLGNSCYFLSAEIATWQEAHFRCRDRGSQLAVLASHYEDSTLRSYLERPEFGNYVAIKRSSQYC